MIFSANEDGHPVVSLEADGANDVGVDLAVTLEADRATDVGVALAVTLEQIEQLMWVLT